MSMNDDIKKYPIYMYYKCRLYPVLWIHNTNDYNHYVYHLHHFIRQSVRKNSYDFYKRVEHLQKLILMPNEMNLDLETMGEESFYKKYNIKKDDLVFSRLKWREGYYDNGAVDGFSEALLSAEM